MLLFTRKGERLSRSNLVLKQIDFYNYFIATRDNCFCGNAFWVKPTLNGKTCTNPELSTYSKEVYNTNSQQECGAETMPIFVENKKFYATVYV